MTFPSLEFYATIRIRVSVGWYINNGITIERIIEIMKKHNTQYDSQEITYDGSRYLVLETYNWSSAEDVFDIVNLVERRLDEELREMESA